MHVRVHHSRASTLLSFTLVILSVLGTASTTPIPVLGQYITTSSYTAFSYSYATVTSGTLTVATFSGVTTLQVPTVTYLTTTVLGVTLTITAYVATQTGLAVPATTQTTTTTVLIPQSTTTIVYPSPTVQINETLVMPVLTQNTTVTTHYLSQTTTVFVTSSSSLTSAASTSTQTASSTTTTSTSSGSWDLLVPMLIIGIGAVMSVILGVVIAVTRRRGRMMPPTHLICPRCRSAVNPYDTVCRMCGTPLYRPYRFYRPTR